MMMASREAGNFGRPLDEVEDINPNDSGQHTEFGGRRECNTTRAAIVGGGLTAAVAGFLGFALGYNVQPDRDRFDTGREVAVALLSPEAHADLVEKVVDARLADVGSFRMDSNTIESSNYPGGLETIRRLGNNDIEGITVQVDGGRLTMRHATDYLDGSSVISTATFDASESDVMRKQRLSPKGVSDALRDPETLLEGLELTVVTPGADGLVSRKFGKMHLGPDGLVMTDIRNTLELNSIVEAATASTKNP